MIKTVVPDIIFAIIFVSFRETQKGTPVVFSINTEIIAY
jgi:hypothetical protein